MIPPRILHLATALAFLLLCVVPSQAAIAQTTNPTQVAPLTTQENNDRLNRLYDAIDYQETLQRRSAGEPGPCLSLTVCMYSIADLYASIIFSESRDVKYADSVQLSFDRIEKFPAGEDNVRRYGELTPPSINSGPQPAGVSLSRYIRTMFKFGWFVPVPEYSDFGNTTIGAAANTWASFAPDNKTGYASASKATGIVSRTALVGAWLYETSVSIADLMETLFTAFDLPYALGLTDTVAPELGAHRTNETTANNLIRGFLNFLGIEGTTIRLGVNLIAVILAGLLLAALIRWAALINKAGTRAALSGTSTESRRVKNYTVRFLTALLGITIIIATGPILGSLYKSVAAPLDKLQNGLSDDYVVDTLDWAIYANLDLNLMLGPGQARPNMAENNVPPAAYAPTPENVRRLNSRIDLLRQNHYQVQGITRLKPGARAVEVLTQLTSGQTADVNNYAQGLDSINACNAGNLNHRQLNRLSQLQRLYGDSSLRARAEAILNRTCRRTYTNLDPSRTAYILQHPDHKYGYLAHKDLQYKDPTTLKGQIHFFTKNEVNARQLQQDLEAQANQEATASESPSANPSTPTTSPTNGTTQTSPTTPEFQETRTYYISGRQFDVPETAPYTINPFNPKATLSYLYGVSAPGNLNDSRANYTNFINGSKPSDQLVNPITGKQVKPDDFSPEAKAIRTNAYRIALYNRYSGAINGRMSDQSTVFFLQSFPQGETGIGYKGVNTPANRVGATKNTGKYGSRFVRYVIPAYDSLDHERRFNLLTAAWTTIGLIAMAALFELLRSSIYGAFARMVTGGIATMVGNPMGIVAFVLFSFAVTFSFISFRLALAIPAWFVTGVFAPGGMVDRAMAGLGFAEHAQAGESWITWLSNGAANNWFVPNTVSQAVQASAAVTGYSTQIPTLTIWLLALLVAGVMVWPMLTLPYGATLSKGRQKVSFVGMLLILPLLGARILYESIYARWVAMVGTDYAAKGMTRWLRPETNQDSAKATVGERGMRAGVQMAGAATKGAMLAAIPTLGASAGVATALGTVSGAMGTISAAAKGNQAARDKIKQTMGETTGRAAGTVVNKSVHAVGRRILPKKGPSEPGYTPYVPEEPGPTTTTGDQAIIHTMRQRMANQDDSPQPSGTMYQMHDRETDRYLSSQMISHGPGWSDQDDTSEPRPPKVPGQDTASLFDRTNATVARSVLDRINMETMAASAQFGQDHPDQTVTRFTPAQTQTAQIAATEAVFTSHTEAALKAQVDRIGAQLRRIDRDDPIREHVLRDVADQIVTAISATDQARWKADPAAYGELLSRVTTMVAAAGDERAVSRGEVDRGVQLVARTATVTGQSVNGVDRAQLAAIFNPDVAQEQRVSAFTAAHAVSTAKAHTVMNRTRHIDVAKIMEDHRPQPRSQGDT